MRVEAPVPAIVVALGTVGARFSCVVVTHCDDAEIRNAVKTDSRRIERKIEMDGRISIMLSERGHR
jgi:hypothetical protein